MGAASQQQQQPRRSSPDGGYALLTTHHRRKKQFLLVLTAWVLVYLTLAQSRWLADVEQLLDRNFNFLNFMRESPRKPPDDGDGESAALRSWPQRVWQRRGEGVASITNTIRPSTNSATHHTHISMARLYEEIPFDDLPITLEGNTLGFHLPTTYDRRRVVEEEPRLEVIVMPHSHNDPGWYETFESYYLTSTGAILSSTHKYLGRMKDVSFEWAEICFLELWWRNHGDEEREALKRVIKSGQLEILTGGWVMADEATTHYYSLVMQLLEGHEWLRNHLGDALPNPPVVSHWGSDLSGLSPTLPYLLQAAGIRQGLHTRAHYAVKAHLAERRQLEFFWRQAWSGASAVTDFLVHMPPMSTIHPSLACGTEPPVCCQFDFSVGKGYPCLGNWGGHVVTITRENVAEKADILADQFRKKAQYYRTNVIFVPWGEDRRYSSEEEWAAQHGNLSMLFNQINSLPHEYNMRVRFGTLRHYFDAVRERLLQMPPQLQLPTLSGDFFTFAQRKGEYRSGYFTSRPFLKHLDRTLQHYVRSADIMFTVAHVLQHGQEAGDGGGKFQKLLLGMYPRLVEARRALSLFQHHDAITGVSLEYVMRDYAEKMVASIITCAQIISNATPLLLFKPTMLQIDYATKHSDIKNDDDDKLYGRSGGRGVLLNSSDNDEVPLSTSPPPLTMVEEFDVADVMALPKRRVIRSVPSELVLFNSLGHAREEVVCVLIPHSATIAAAEKRRRKRAGKRDEKVGDGNFREENNEGEKEGVVKILRVYEKLLVRKEEGETLHSNSTTNNTAKWRPLRLQQLQPVIEVDANNGELTFARDKQELCFLAQTPALGFRRFRLDYYNAGEKKVDDDVIMGGSEEAPRPVKIFSSKVTTAARSFEAEGADATKLMQQDFVVEPIANLNKQQQQDNNFSLLELSNDRLTIGVDPTTGFLRQISKQTYRENAQGTKYVSDENGQATRRSRSATLDMLVELSFVMYKLKAHSSISPTSSDAYFFMPDGEAQPVQAPCANGNSFIIIDGPLRKSLVVKLPLLGESRGCGKSKTPKGRSSGGGGNEPSVLHRVELDLHSEALAIRNLVDIRRLHNMELAMRLKTQPALSDFYTELNAYQFIRRARHRDKLPLEAHFFPMAGAVFLESGESRLSLLGRQALGTASLEAGWMEVMLDRRVAVHKGYMQGANVMDNCPTQSDFLLLWEEELGTINSRDETEGRRRSIPSPRQTTSDANEDDGIAYPSKDAQKISLQLHSPLVVQFTTTSSQNIEEEFPSSLSLLAEPLPCDVHLLALRTLSGATNYTADPAQQREGGDGGGEDSSQKLLVNFTSLPTLPRRAAALILHRMGVLGGAETSDGAQISMWSLFAAGIAPPRMRVAEASLTLMRVAKQSEDEEKGGGNVSQIPLLELDPMEIKSWQIEF